MRRDPIRWTPAQHTLLLVYECARDSSRDVPDPETLRALLRRKRPEIERLVREEKRA